MDKTWIQVKIFFVDYLEKHQTISVAQLMSLTKEIAKKAPLYEDEASGDFYVLADLKKSDLRRMKR